MYVEEKKNPFCLVVGRDKALDMECSCCVKANLEFFWLKYLSWHEKYLFHFPKVIGAILKNIVC